jgi:hypothetical protein
MALFDKVTCGIHGVMKYRAAMKWWECVGFDGEGCCILTDEDIYLLVRGRPFDPTSEILPVYYEHSIDGELSRILVKGTADSDIVRNAWGGTEAPPSEV